MAAVADRFDPEIRRAISGGMRAAVIPVGALEQHGPHLPVSTDCTIAGEIARRLCKRTGYLLLPALPYGVSFEHAPLFNVSIGTGTLRRMILDIASSLASGGIKTLFVLNGHHGNQKALGNLGPGDPHKIKIFALSYWHFMDGPFDHAGLVETSLMLAISGKVRMSRAIKGFIEPPMGRAERARMARMASRSFTSVAKNGVWGDPRGASAARGSRLLAEIVGNMERQCQRHLAGRGPSHTRMSHTR